MKKLFSIYNIIFICICLTLAAVLFIAYEERLSKFNINDSEDIITITWQRGKDYTAASQELISTFEATHPKIKIKYVELPFTSSVQHETYSNELAKKDSSFDVMTLDVIWIPEFSSKNYLLPLDSYFTPEQLSDFYPISLKPMYYKNKLYSIPSWIDMGMLYYRKDLVKYPPKNWNELIKLSNENVGKNGIDTGFLMQATDNEAIVCNALEFIGGNGGSCFDDNGNVSIYSKEAIDGISLMRSLISLGISPSGILNYSSMDCANLFKKGSVLFMRNWPFAYSIVNSSNSTIRGEVGVAPIPMGSSGSTNFSTLGGWSYSVNKDSEHKNEAIEFVKFLTSKEGEKINLKYGSYLSPRKSFYVDNNEYSDFTDFFNYAHPRPICANYNEISRIIQNNMYDILSYKVSAKDGLYKCSEDLKHILNK